MTPELGVTLGPACNRGGAMLAQGTVSGGGNGRVL